MPARAHFADSEKAKALIASDPMAPLVGLVLDQQVFAQKVFAGPLALGERLGALDAATLASAAHESMFSARPAIHCPRGSIPKRVHHLAAHVLEPYDGDAGRVWKAADSNALAPTLPPFPGSAR